MPAHLHYERLAYTRRNLTITLFWKLYISKDILEKKEFFFSLFLSKRHQHKVILPFGK